LSVAPPGLESDAKGLLGAGCLLGCYRRLLGRWVPARWRVISFSWGANTLIAFGTGVG